MGINNGGGHDLLLILRRNYDIMYVCYGLLRSVLILLLVWSGVDYLAIERMLRLGFGYNPMDFSYIVYF